MRTRQRQWIAEHGGGVVEGRDIGSVVFPDATLKVYLVASPLVRAKRRVAQHGGDVEEIARAIAERDQRDSTREDSPLRQMPDAVVVDTSDHTVPEVIEEIRRLLLERGAALRSATSESDSATGDAADRLSS
jgi:cytidylate kinase